MNLLEIFWLMYTIMACIVFSLFCIGKLNFHLVGKDGEEYIPNWIYGILIALFSIAWPIAIIYLLKDMEE